MSEKKYITISVPRKVKDLLEKGKGDMDWGEYLMLLYREYDRIRRIYAFRELRKILSEEEIKEIGNKLNMFRKQFRLR